jgi:hypothetical protein
MKNYILFNHQQKANAYVSALAPKYKAVARTSPEYKTAAFILTDNHVLSRGRLLEKMRREGLRNFFLYPHAGRPSLVNSFYEPWTHITAEFVAAEGHIEIMRRIGNKNKLHAVGWSLCPLREFQPRTEVRRVLFAPIHPRNAEADKRVNRAAHDRLCRLAMAGEIVLTVRYLVPLDGNGIRRVDHPSITYHEGAAGPDWKQIDDADVVVAHQTFAMLAIARGVPTVMFGEDVPPHIEYRNGSYMEARGWDEIKDLVMYPLDLLQYDDTLALLRGAACDDAPIRDWRDRMIGKAFDPAVFVDRLESYL